MDMTSFLRYAVFTLSVASIGTTKPLFAREQLNPQTSFVLDPNVVAPGFAQDGQEISAPGQSPSLTSTNNFINFCRDVGLPLTDGKQLAGGSCNPAPMGAIPATSAMPYTRFEWPMSFSEPIKANTPIPITVTVKNLDTGWFVNPITNYASAPQELGRDGLVKGHSHVVIEHADSRDVKNFVWFKGLNENPDKNGKWQTVVAEGLPSGNYRISTITTAANHQPVLLPVAQRGAVDDTVYFTVAPHPASSLQNAVGSVDSAHAGANGTGDPQQEHQDKHVAVTIGANFGHSSSSPLSLSHLWGSSSGSESRLIPVHVGRAENGDLGQQKEDLSESFGPFY